jgi:Transcriptional regulator, AbiEi antitoxin
MGPRILAIFARQHGLITFRQATEAGLSATSIPLLLRSGEWVRLRGGVFVDGEIWAASDEYVGRPLLRVRAAHLSLTVPHWFSHDSAALLHGMRLFDRDTDLVHITRTDMRGRRSKAGITQHGAKFDPTRALVIDGLPVLDLARTALDVTREHGYDVGLGACDFALRQGLARRDLLVVTDSMRRWPRVQMMREVVELADAGAENAFESAGRSLVLELGIGRPQTQFGLTDGARTVWCDLRVGRHIFECDGRVKVTPVAAGGVAKDPIAALWKEKKRQDFVCGFKLGMSRITKVDTRSGRAAARARLMREYDDTVARFGDSIDDLAPYIVHRRR